MILVIAALVWDAPEDRDRTTSSCLTSLTQNGMAVSEARPSTDRCSRSHPRLRLEDRLM